MQTHVPGSPITTVFSLLIESGEPLSPSALRWRVSDETETVIQDWTPQAPVPGAESVSVVIPAALNVLVAPSLRGLRIVELEVTLADGAVRVLTQSYFLKSANLLIAGENSFATYPELLMLTMDFASSTLAGWERYEDRSERELALIEAFQAISRLPLFVERDLDNQSVIRDEYLWNRRTWFSDIKPNEYLTVVPAKQRLALARAQLLEASALLEADPVVMARREGLMSTSVGESSQFFRTSKPLDLPIVSQRALTLVKPYLSWTVRVGRR